MSKYEQSRSHQPIDTKTNRELVRKHGGQLDIPRNILRMTTKNSNNANCCRKQMELTKLLLNVTVQNSLGLVQVVMKPNDTVKDLITAGISVYVKEKRRPFLNCHNSMCFELHYSQFSLECLNWEEQLMNLGSRNFFLCHKLDSSSTTSNKHCCHDFQEGVQFSFPLMKFMDFLL
ncbi:hypothetical protein Leryth_023227 [Lithospermum erythrorhizon]|nr:hypothetical protein Leryth_023227 [Lithospermum erythrorhizon]